MPRANAHLQPARDHLTEHGETRASELAAALGCKPGTLIAALKRAIDRGEIAERKEGKAKFYSLGQVQPDAPAEDVENAPYTGPIRWSHWDDRDIVLYGLVENDDGSHTLPADVVQQIKNRLAWSPVR